MNKQIGCILNLVGERKKNADLFHLLHSDVYLVCRCICLLKLWQREPSRWECRVPWRTASHLRLFWSVQLDWCPSTISSAFE